MSPRIQKPYLVNESSPFFWQACLIFILVFCFNLLSAIEARSEPNTPNSIVETPYVKVQLVPERNSIEPGRPLTLGIHFQIKPGWHTYWKNPGDSGEPLKVYWESIPGIQLGPLQFPYPHLIKMLPLANYGYEKEAMFLVSLQPDESLKPGETVELKARATWLVCAEICLPEKGEFSLSLPVHAQSAEINQTWQSKFVVARQKIPQVVPTNTVQFSEERSEENQEGNQKKTTWLWLRFDPEKLISFSQDEKLHGKTNIEKAWHFFPENQGQIEAAADQFVEQEGQELRIRLQTVPQWDKTSLDQIKTLSGVLVAGHQAFQIEAQPELSSPEQIGAAFSWTIPWNMLLFAFAGGLLLNLMPCVFPVLSIKVLSFVKKSNEHPQHVKAYAWMYALGVLVSFWVLTGVLLILKQLGNQLGWGFQLQSPVFIVGLIFLFFLLSFSLLGVFEVGTRWMGLGSTWTQRHGYLGSFFTGVLATVVATPCMAPMMGPALGFALTQDIGTTGLVLSVLAIGMASPYVLLCYVPQALRLLPKPGPWMETFKQLMAFPLLATVLWLLWVLSQQSGTSSIFYVLGGLLLSGLALWIYQRGTQKNFEENSLKPKSITKRWKRLGPVFLTLALGFSLGLLGAQPKPLPNSTKANFPEPHVGWVPFSSQALQEYRATGRPVFLNFTAAWCLTCQVNERLVFSKSKVQERFAQLDAVLMKGDWTRQDAAITQALESYGRQGVPVYVWYAKGENAVPKILPEILTQEVLFRYLNENPKNGDSS